MIEKTPFPITPSTGGVVIFKNIVCRDQIIDTYWQILINQGISLFAERRFGKSSIIRKMDAENIDGFISIYKSTNGIKSIDDFVEALFSVAKEKGLLSKVNLDSLSVMWNTIAEMIPGAMGVKVGKINHVWQKKLNSLIANILESNPNKKLVFFLDEFSLMLDAMETADAAILIGYLRDIVHDTFPERLRFVYTGSISIDLIFNKLKKDGHNLGDPLNHTERMRLHPFDEGQTAFFCMCLELGCKIELDDTKRTLIYLLTDGIPYFIDRVFNKIRYSSQVTKDTINEAMYNIINDPIDVNNLNYYYDRINEHYPDPDLSYLILKALCKEENIPEKDLMQIISSQLERAPRIIQEEIQRLWKDGYLHMNNKDNKREYAFLYSVIKSWWKANKA